MLIIISGSAGVGKNTIITEILNNHSNIKLMQTCTTRQPRNTDGDMHNPYIYVTREEFENKIKRNEVIKIKNGDMIEYINSSYIMFFG